MWGRPASFSVSPLLCCSSWIPRRRAGWLLPDTLASAPPSFLPSHPPASPIAGLLPTFASRPAADKYGGGRSVLLGSGCLAGSLRLRSCAAHRAPLRSCCRAGRGRRGHVADAGHRLLLLPGTLRFVSPEPRLHSSGMVPQGPDRAQWQVPAGTDMEGCWHGASQGQERVRERNATRARLCNRMKLAAKPAPKLECNAWGERGAPRRNQGPLCVCVSL